GWGPDELRHEPTSPMAACRLLRGPHPQGYQASRPARRAADDLRLRGEPEDRPRAGHYVPQRDPAAGHRGDRVEVGPALLECPNPAAGPGPVGSSAPGAWPGTR